MSTTSDQQHTARPGGPGHGGDHDGGKKGTDPVHTAHRWLVEAGRALGVDPDALTPVIPDLLDLTRDVAHGPSRPAAPLTSFLVGLAAGRELSAAAAPEECTGLVREKIAGLQPLLAEWADAKAATDPLDPKRADDTRKER